MWWHSYSKITVCLLLWNISLKYGQDPKHTQSRITKTCTGIKKTNKPIDAPNLHRHQKNQKKLKFPGTMGPLLSSCWNFCFFGFFWCLSMFGASSGLFFLVFLVPVDVLWSQSHQTCTGTKKTKKTKPLDAPNLHRHQKKPKKLKFPGTMGPLLSSCWIFCFFCCFWCLSMFCEVRVTKPALDAPNLHRHQKKQKN